MRRCLALLLALSALGCGVGERDVLVGRYAVRGRAGEAWVLEDDGTCRVERGTAVEACEWEYREDASGTRLRVTMSAPAGSVHQRRFVLTPSKWPGQPVTIPLAPGATLEKLD